MEQWNDVMFGLIGVGTILLGFGLYYGMNHSFNRRRDVSPLTGETKGTDGPASIGIGREDTTKYLFRLGVPVALVAVVVGLLYVTHG